MKKFRLAVVALYLLSFVSPVVSLAATAPKKVNTNTVKKEVKSSFSVKNSQMIVGDKWSTEFNFVSATDDAGNKLTWKDIGKDVKTKGIVDTTKVGKYPVTYTWNKITQIATIEVIEKPKPKVSLKELKVKNVTLTQGQAYDVSQSFESAVLTDGNVLGYKDVAELIKVDNLVNTNQPGKYNVTFTSGTLKAISEVTIVAKKIEPIELKLVNSKLKVGDKWSPDVNFQSIILSDGTVLSWNQVAKDLIVTGSVDTSKIGNYNITYQYGNLKQTVTVTVEAKEVITVQEIKVKNTTLEANSEWEAKDNFDYILLSNGKKQTWEEVGLNVFVTGKVDTTKPGTYEVVYTYGEKTATATVNV
ncbi:bacterial Ig-like domain-containing protein, partial [Vagococcus sp.]